ncbi:MAG: putative amidophosphoribosyltransferase [Yoonia sp.]|jgi:predicted amidophosphoribosyltransferase
MQLQSVIRAIYPPQCVACDALTDADFGLCGACWSKTVFIDGLVCDRCGTPLPGDDDGTRVQRDDCMTIARPWDQGRAVFAY